MVQVICIMSFYILKENCYCISSFISPNLIHFCLRIHSEKNSVKIPGRRKCIKNILTKTSAVLCVWHMYCHAEIEQLNPSVPSPALAAELVILNKVVEIGPNIALDKITGSQIIGFFRMFAICKVEVPSP